MELFGGIGAPRKALEKLHIDFKTVDYVDIDKFATKSYNAIFEENFTPQDVTTWDKDLDIDLIFHGSPCQDFSIAGKSAGGDKDSGTRSSLMFETIRIVKKLKPKYVIWENVKGVLTKTHKHNFDNYLSTLQELGYTNYYQILNACDYGIPQSRERVFVVSILGDHKPFIFPEKQELKIKLKDILEKDVEEKYYLTEDRIKKILEWKAYEKPFKKVCGNNSITSTLRAAGNEHSGMILFSDKLDQTTDLENTLKPIQINSKVNGEHPSRTDRVYSSNGVFTTLTTCMNPNILVEEEVGLYDDTSSNQFAKGKRDLGYRDTYCTLKVNPKCSIYKNTDLRIRKITPLEAWRLMSFEDTDFYKAKESGISDTQLLKQAGNSIVVNVVYELFKSLFRED